jgi:hypothetical protein
VLGPDSLSRFEELSVARPLEPRSSMFDLIEYNDEDLRNRHSWTGDGVGVSKSVDGTYRSGPCRVRIKVCNRASIAVQRERSEIW